MKVSVNALWKLAPFKKYFKKKNMPFLYENYSIKFPTISSAPKGSKEGTIVQTF